MKVPATNHGCNNTEGPARKSGTFLMYVKIDWNHAALINLLDMSRNNGCRLSHSLRCLLRRSLGR